MTFHHDDTPAPLWLCFDDPAAEGAILWSRRAEPGLPLALRSREPGPRERARCDCGHVGEYDRQGLGENPVWIDLKTGSLKCGQCDQKEP